MDGFSQKEPVNSVTRSGSLSLGLGTKPSRGCEAFAFPISTHIFRAKCYRRATWQDSFSGHVPLVDRRNVGGFVSVRIVCRPSLCSPGCWHRRERQGRNLLHPYRPGCVQNRRGRQVNLHSQGQRRRALFWLSTRSGNSPTSSPGCLKSSQWKPQTRRCSTPAVARPSS